MLNRPLVRLDAQKWEYKIVKKEGDAKNAIRTEELAALGMEG